MKNNKDLSYYEKQRYLLDLAVEILRKGFAEKKSELEGYEELFFFKHIPPHIMQPLQSLRNKILFKPVYKKVETELDISHYKAKKIIEYNGFSFINEKMPQIKKEIKKINKDNWVEFEKFYKNLNKILK